jgi:uncharacterized membrane protein
LTAKIFIYLGLMLLAIGLLLSVAPGALSWFGKLPGDINIQRGGTRIYIPFTSMLLISVVLTLLVNLLRR